MQCQEMFFVLLSLKGANDTQQVLGRSENEQDFFYFSTRNGSARL